jgi:hypothetical protein
VSPRWPHNMGSQSCGATIRDLPPELGDLLSRSFAQTQTSCVVSHPKTRSMASACPKVSKEIQGKTVHGEQLQSAALTQFQEATLRQTRENLTAATRNISRYLGAHAEGNGTLTKTFPRKEDDSHLLSMQNQCHIRAK